MTRCRSNIQHIVSSAVMQRTSRIPIGLLSVSRRISILCILIGRAFSFPCKRPIRQVQCITTLTSALQHTNTLPQSHFSSKQRPCSNQSPPALSRPNNLSCAPRPHPPVPRATTSRRLRPPAPCSSSPRASRPPFQTGPPWPPAAVLPLPTTAPPPSCFFDD